MHICSRKRERIFFRVRGTKVWYGVGHIETYTLHLEPSDPGFELMTSGLLVQRTVRLSHWGGKIDYMEIYEFADWKSCMSGMAHFTLGRGLILV